MRAVFAAGVILVLAAPLAAQDAAGDGRPLSAIDWLTQSGIAPVIITPPPAAFPLPGQPPVAQSILTPPVTVTPLDAPSPDRVGLLPASLTGLPRDLWSGSPEAQLIQLIRAERDETLPATRSLLLTLLLAEAEPPLGAGSDGALFQARVDRLLDLGALEPAQALLEAAGPTTSDLFRRYFDVTLLTGTEDRACTILHTRPDLAPTLQARVFCLARDGDWSAAALTLNSAAALGEIEPREEALLTRFLDPDLFEGLPPLPLPDRPNPLDFRLREAIGEGLPSTGLPLAYAHADLRAITGWKARLEAAERLARHGAISENVLLDLYTLQKPAASGGVWDRAAAVQALEAALESGAPDRVAEALPDAWRAIQPARLEVPFARLFGEKLAEQPLSGEAARLAFRIGLLSDVYEQIAIDHAPANSNDAFLAAIARGAAPAETPAAAPAPAIHAAFSGATPPERLRILVSEGRLGEALLRALALFDQGAAGDPTALTDALAFFRATGLEEVARKAALQLMILDRDR